MLLLPLIDVDLTKYVSSVEPIIYITSKNKQKKQTANIMLLLFPNICAYFSLQNLQFLLVGRKNIFYFLAQGTLATPLITL